MSISVLTQIFNSEKEIAGIRMERRGDQTVLEARLDGASGNFLRQLTRLSYRHYEETKDKEETFQMEEDIRFLAKTGEVSRPTYVLSRDRLYLSTQKGTLDVKFEKKCRSNRPYDDTLILKAVGKTAWVTDYSEILLEEMKIV